MAAQLPALQLVQKLGAGVETIMRATDLPPQVRVARLKPQLAAQEIAEYCIAYVLRDQRQLLRYEADAHAKRWDPVPPKQAGKTTVGVLGLGHIGAEVARRFALLDFRVLGWSRSPKSIEGVACSAGLDTLPDLLAACDHVISVLPATPETRDLFDARRLAQMKPAPA